MYGFIIKNAVLIISIGYLYQAAYIMLLFHAHGLA